MVQRGATATGMVLGAAIAMMVLGAADLVVTGLRVDAEGTSSRVGDTLIGWGGLLGGALLLAVGAVLRGLAEKAWHREHSAA